MESLHNRIILYVNGSKVEVFNPNPPTRLLQYLRETLNLPGTKYGCGEGYCGACTVMVSWFDRKTEKIKHETVTSCLVPLISVHGKAVTTIEALGSLSTRLHPVQERLAKSHGTQCGFCSPGMVMSMYTLLRNYPEPTMEQIQNAIKGNLCRCTGYRPILEAFNTFAKDCPMGDQCCQSKAKTEKPSVVPSLLPLDDFGLFDPTQEPIFPSELQINAEYDKESLKLERDGIIWYRPSCLQDLLGIKSNHPDAQLIAGNTDVGFSVSKSTSKVYVYIKHLTELRDTRNAETGVTLGAALSLGELKDELEKQIQDLPSDKTKLFREIVASLEPIESEQILNLATIGGHIASASPVSDIIPILTAGHCLVNITSTEIQGHPKAIPLRDVISSDGGTALPECEFITGIFLPYSTENEYFACLSQTGSRIDLRTTVNCGMRVEMKPGTDTVKDIDMIYNGLGCSAAVMATKTKELIIGRKWDGLLEEVCARLEVGARLVEELSPSQGGRLEFRRTMIRNHFHRFHDKVKEIIQVSTPAHQNFSPKSGNQIFADFVKDQFDTDTIGRPIAHLSAEKHVTGEAEYIDDIPISKGELFLALVMSTEAHAKIVEIDATEALQVPGVKGLVTHNDAVNNIHEEAEIIASNEVHHVGQLVTGIVAETKEEAFKAAKLVKVKYEPMTPILTVQDAIDNDSFMAMTIENREGDVEKGFGESNHVIEGEVECGGQLHFYMETQSALVVPKDGNEYEVFHSTQNPAGTQKEISTAIGVQLHKVFVRTKRVGGAFGGKETQGALVSTPSAIAAAKFKRPVRCVLPRKVDKPLTGGRHPLFVRYKVGVDGDGRIKALEANYYLNGGHSLDLSVPVMMKQVLNNFVVYKIPNLHTRHRICRTNLPSNTAFRGLGAPQITFVWQEIVEHIAYDLGLNPSQVHDRNLNEEGDVVPNFGLKLEHYNLRRVWTQLLEESSFHKRHSEIQEFNRHSRNKKKGIAVNPMAFAPGFMLHEMNQATALVHVYLDGSVLVAHGGVEMGQGLHTKTTQVASQVLGVPVDMIHQSENSTSTVANSVTTAASVSTDLYGSVVKNACQVIVERLRPFREAKPDGSWTEWVNEAYNNHVCLSVTEHFSWDFIKSRILPYLVFGAACSEVEIDCRTGEHELIRTDIVMDIGKSLNPAIDVGQIEGAFVQGYGYYVKEEVVFDEKGSLKTRGPLTYRIPRCTDIPGKLNVHILKDCPNNTPVYSSKAVGEPPLMLSISVFCAVKSAVAAARADRGLTGYFRFDAPASAERVVLGCTK